MPEEQEGLKGLDGAFDYKWVAVSGGMMIRGATIGRGGRAAFGAFGTLVAEWRRRHCGACSSFDTFAIEEYNVGLDLCEEGCRSLVDVA